MFGNLDLNFGNDQDFKKYQCSLCHAMAKNYGIFARFLTNYDSTLCLIIALKYTRKDVRFGRRTCPLLTRRKVAIQKESLTCYIAALTVILISEKIHDDIYDERKKFPTIILRWLERRRQKAETILIELGFDHNIIKTAFDQQRLIENDTNISLVQLTEPTAHVMSEIYAHLAVINQTPEYEKSLRQIGYALGQIIYLFDGIADFQRDIQIGTFNPLHGCSPCASINKEIPIPEDNKVEVSRLLRTAQCEIQSAVRSLPKDAYVSDILGKRLSESIETYIRMSVSCNDAFEDSLMDRDIQAAPLTLFFSLPRPAWAANNVDSGTSFCEGLLFLLVMLFLFRMIFKRCMGGIGCCSTKQETVSVDHGCRGTKTYKHDPCTGKYRNDRCC